MEPLTWSGALGPILNPIMLAALVVFALGFVSNFILNARRRSRGRGADQPRPHAHHRPHAGGLRADGDEIRRPALRGLLRGLHRRRHADADAGGQGHHRWHGRAPDAGLDLLVVVFAASIYFKRKLGLYGKLFDSPIGMVGFGLVMFWIFAAAFAGVVATHGPSTSSARCATRCREQPLPSPEDGQYLYYLLGGDNLGRDVFSRMIYGAQEVLKITPAATLFAFMVGVTLGLPAGYFGGRLDTAITFIANLALAFPVILLFFLLVTPEIVAAGVPQYMSMVLFIFPIMFFVVLFNSRYHTQAPKRNLLVGATLVVGLIAYFSLISNADDDPDLPLVFRLWPEALDLFDIQGNLLIVFVSVVFVNSPTVFRIVRGIVLDIKTRDYVAAGADPRRGPVVHHAVGDPAQRARAADRRFLPAHRLHHDPSGNAGLLRPRRQPRKARTGARRSTRAAGS
jgi:peptide/nickel transport system permease protein